MLSTVPLQTLTSWVQTEKERQKKYKRRSEKEKEVVEIGAEDERGRK